MYGMAREGIVPRVFARTHRSRRTPWVAIVFTTLVSLLLIVSVGAEGVGTFANATVAFLLAIFALVCWCGISLRRDRVSHEHYTAPTVLLGIGVLVNIALLLYVLVSDLQALFGGEIGALESTTVVCGLMLAIGLGLYVVNTLAQRRLDTAPMRGEVR
jgi:amino acid transporter